MKTLHTNEIDEALKGLPGWRRIDGTPDGAIGADYRFAGYPECVAFAVEIALYAQRVDHHPDALTVRWGRVSVSYVTHSAKGITQNDVDAARQVVAIAKRVGAEVIS